MLNVHTDIKVNPESKGVRTGVLSMPRHIRNFLIGAKKSENRARNVIKIKW